MKTNYSFQIIALFFVGIFFLSCSKDELDPQESTSSQSDNRLKMYAISSTAYPNEIDVFKTADPLYYTATYYGTKAVFPIPYYIGVWKEGDLACDYILTITPTYSLMYTKLSSTELHNAEEITIGGRKITFFGTKIYYYSSNVSSNSTYGPMDFKIIRTHLTSSTFALVNASYVPVNPSSTVPPLPE